MRLSIADMKHYVSTIKEYMYFFFKQLENKTKQKKIKLKENHVLDKLAMLFQTGERQGKQGYSGAYSINGKLAGC